MGMPKLLLSRTWKSSLSLQPALPPWILILWRLEVQREKLTSAGHWGEESRSRVVGVGGRGNDKFLLPSAGSFEGPGERESHWLRVHTPHSLCSPPLSCSWPQRPV